MEEQPTRIAIVSDIARALVKDSTLHAMLQECAEALVKHLDAAFVRIWTLNDKDQVLELRASAGMYTHLNGTHSRVPVGTLKIGLIALERRPHLTNAVVGDPRVSEQEWARREGMVAFAGYPLIVEDHLVGVVGTFARHTFGQETLQLLASVADSLALGIEHKRAEEALRASLAREREARLLAERQRVEAVTLADERDRARAETQAGWTRFESLFRQAPAAVAVLRGPQHVYELANPLYVRLVGKQELDLLGKPGREVLPDPTFHGVWDIFDRIYATGEPYRGSEFPVQIDRTGEGEAEQCYFNFVGQPTFDLSGNVDGILIHAVDVTEQVHARQRIQDLADELETQRARLALGQRAGRIGTFDRNLETGEVIWTPDLEALYGYGSGELQDAGTDWTSLVHPDDQAVVRESIRCAIAEHRAIHVEFRVIRKDGSIAHMLAEGTVEYHDDGSPRRVVGVNVDVTDRKQAESNLAFLSDASKLLSSSLNYETTLESVAHLAVPHVGDWCAIDMIADDGSVRPVAVAHKDPEKVAWARELRELNPIDLTAPQGLPEVLRTGKPELYSYISDEMLVAMARDETELELMRSIGFTSAIIVPISSKGSPIGGITFVTTESRRRYTEGDLAMAEELASRASLAIENARLYGDAQSALALRDEFISVASHELKTPVTTLKVYAQMLARQTQRRGDTGMASQLVKMERQVDRLTRLINDLLDVSKIQAGKLDYGSQVFNVEDLVREIVEVPMAVDEAHTISVSSYGSVLVAGDRERIGQIITNLLTNAVKYSPDSGCIELHIDREGEMVWVSVRDHGIGIDPRFHERIFDRFYQVSGPEERTFPGLGMGLYISREIARRHGGDIRVESVKGEGSTFSLILPVAQMAMSETNVQGS